jgi:hypothetical protein
MDLPFTSYNSLFKLLDLSESSFLSPIKLNVINNVKYFVEYNGIF